MSGGTSLSTIWNVWWTQKCWKNRPHPASLSSMLMIKIPIEIAAILPLFTTKSFYSWSIFTMWRVFQVISDTVCNRWLMNKTKLKIAASCCMLLHVAVGILVIWAKNAANWRTHYWAIESFSFKLSTLSEALSIRLSVHSTLWLSIHPSACLSICPSIPTIMTDSTLVWNVKVLDLNPAPASILVKCWNNKCQLLTCKLATSLWQMSVCFSVCPSIC